MRTDQLGWAQLTVSPPISRRWFRRVVLSNGQIFKITKIGRTTLMVRDDAGRKYKMPVNYFRVFRDIPSYWTPDRVKDEIEYLDKYEPNRAMTQEYRII